MPNIQSMEQNFSPLAEKYESEITRRRIRESRWGECWEGDRLSTLSQRFRLAWDSLRKSLSQRCFRDTTLLSVKVIP
jgi:hypothetical protein